VPNGVVDEENAAYALASCVDCQTVAAAFQLVLVTRDVRELVPHNEAFAANVLCAECLTWASAKQIVIGTGGPATLTGEGHIRMRALENRIEALEWVLPALTLEGLRAELDAAFAEFLSIATQEVRRIDGGPEDAEVVAIRGA
jgi:putative peptide zinc metalloprotease protein